MGKDKIINENTFDNGFFLAALAYLGWRRGGLQGSNSGGDGVEEVLVPRGGATFYSTLLGFGGSQ